MLISKMKIPLIWLMILGGILAFGLLIVWATTDLRAAEASESQPVEYSHRVHIQAEIQCLFCHTEATRSPIAGIPSVEKCMGCHAYIATEGETVQTLVGYWERDEPIPWKRVINQPDFVYFSHQPHMGAGMNCETCHGNIAEMDDAQAVTRMDMGWCLDCHEEQESHKIARLVDCLICHK
jgi:c(7)-type cytochrome triheme protein